jgi:cytochrome c biogenesis protein CcmG/thiol:disulfide interchange protein DsbE
MRRRLAWILGVIALAAVVAYGLNSAPESKGPKAQTKSKISAQELRDKLTGAPAPLAALHREANRFLPGERAGLRARLRELRGHPVVINVWGSWCGPCRVELPMFQRASLDWGRRVAFLGVDSKDNRESAERLLADIPVTYPSFDDSDAKIFNGYKLLAAPSTIYYDSAGTQTYIHQGQYLDRHELDADIRRYAL